MIFAFLFAAAAFALYAPYITQYIFTGDVMTPLDGCDKGFNYGVTKMVDVGNSEQSFNASRDLDFAGMSPIFELVPKWIV